MRKFALVGGMGCGLLLVGSLALAATDKEELEAMQREVAAATAQKSLAELKYGTALQGKSGNVTEPGKLNGIAQQRQLWLGAKTAKDLGGAVVAEANAGECAGKSLLVTDDAAVATKLMLATSLNSKMSELQRQMHDLKEDVDKQGAAAANTRSLALAATSIQGAANSIVGIWKLFQADYTVDSFSPTNNADWIVAHFMSGAVCQDSAGKPCAYSNRFPATSDSKLLADKVTKLVEDAEELRRVAERKFGKSKGDKEKQLLAATGELLKAVTALQTALLDGGTTGVAPLATIAPYVRAKSERSCIVRIIDSAPAGIVVTKETIFGKGGKVYLHSTTQLAAIVTDIEGIPRHMFCRQRDLAVTVRLSELSKKNAPVEVAAWKNGTSTSSADCLN